MLFYRVESSYCKLKNMLHSSRENLCICCNAVNTMLKLQLGAIRSLFQKRIQHVAKELERTVLTNFRIEASLGQHM